MGFEDLISSRETVLTEGAVIEPLNRDPAVQLDPHILHAGFVFEAEGREALGRIYRGYLDIGAGYDMHMIVGTPTWRANPERILRATQYSCDEVNREAAAFLAEIRAEYGEYSKKIWIAGLLGPKGDAYDPSDSPSEDESAEFHGEQAKSLAASDVDFLLVATLPAAPEACGLARALSFRGSPYVLSFIVRPTGHLLDGTPLHEAVSRVDAAADAPPLCYSINCVHPTVFAEALRGQLEESNALRERIIWLQANTSTLPPEALNRSTSLQTEDPSTFARLMLKLKEDLGTRILGGCCGTGPEHIRSLAEMLSKRTQST